MWQCPDFSVGAGYLNSGPHIHEASTLMFKHSYPLGRRLNLDLELLILQLPPPQCTVCPYLWCWEWNLIHARQARYQLSYLKAALTLVFDVCFLRPVFLCYWLASDGVMGGQWLEQVFSPWRTSSAATSPPPSPSSGTDCCLLVILGDRCVWGWGGGTGMGG